MNHTTITTGTHRVRYSQPCPDCGVREEWHWVPEDLPEDADLHEYVDSRNFVPCRCYR